MFSVCYLVNLRAALGALSTFVTKVAWFFVGLVGMWFRRHMYAPHLP